MGFFLGSPSKYSSQVYWQQQGFLSQLISEQTAAFGGSQAALDTVRAMWQPIAMGGDVPVGWSDSLDSLYRSEILDSGSRAAANAMNAAALRYTQETGGAPVLPTGARDQVNAMIDANEQQATASNLRQNEIARREFGLQKLGATTNALLGVAHAENAPAMGSLVVNQQANLGKTAEEMFQQSQATSTLSQIGHVAQVVGQIEGDVMGFGNIASQFLGTPSAPSVAGSPGDTAAGVMSSFPPPPMTPVP